jgi:hypothetical protein
LVGSASRRINEQKLERGALPILLHAPFQVEVTTANAEMLQSDGSQGPRNGFRVRVDPQADVQSL